MRSLRSFWPIGRIMDLFSCKRKNTGKNSSAPFLHQVLTKAKLKTKSCTSVFKEKLVKKNVIIGNRQEKINSIVDYNEKNSGEENSIYAANKISAKKKIISDNKRMGIIRKVYDSSKEGKSVADAKKKSTIKKYSFENKRKKRIRVVDSNDSSSREENSRSDAKKNIFPECKRKKKKSIRVVDSNVRSSGEEYSCSDVKKKRKRKKKNVITRFKRIKATETRDTRAQSSEKRKSISDVKNKRAMKNSISAFKGVDDSKAKRRSEENTVCCVRRKPTKKTIIFEREKMKNIVSSNENSSGEDNNIPTVKKKQAKKTVCPKSGQVENNGENFSIESSSRKDSSMSILRKKQAKKTVFPVHKRRNPIKTVDLKSKHSGENSSISDDENESIVCGHRRQRTEKSIEKKTKQKKEKNCHTKPCRSQAAVDMNGPTAKYVKDIIQQDVVVIFSKSYCPYCTLAKEVFDKLKRKYTCIELDNRNDGDNIQNILCEITGARTVPRVFVNGVCIGGGSDVKSLHEKGELEKMLACK